MAAPRFELDSASNVVAAFTSNEDSVGITGASALEVAAKPLMNWLTCVSGEANSLSRLSSGPIRPRVE